MRPTADGRRWRLAPVILLVLSLAAAGLRAETAPRSITIVAEGTVHRPLYGIDFHQDLQRGIAVGARGTVITSDDGGRSWAADQLETPLSLIDVAVQGDRRLTVGQMGGIWVSDSGEPWRAVESGTEERLMSVDLNAAGLAIAVGSFDLILLSYDGGETWEESPLQLAPHVEGHYDPHLYDVQVNPDGSALIVGEFGLILRTIDQGRNWDIVHQGVASLSGVHVRTDGTGFAVGQDGAVLRTADGGQTWTRLATPTSGNLLGVWSTGDGQATVSGMRYMIVSDDDGDSWRPVADAEVNTNWYGKMAATDAGFIAVGHSGRVIRVAREQSR
ncbi:MAG: YCF48-related protein [Gammaproteobacteria bacterium]|nr:YCF48-related protein [Gammaproteobacteria bacterium]